MGVLSFAGVWIAAIVLVLLFLCFGCLILLSKKRKLDRKTGREYTSFYIQDGEFVVNNAIQTKYALSEIDHVIIGIAASVSGPYRMQGHHGYMRIVKTDGYVSPKWNFDCSIYTKRLQLSGADFELLKSIQMVEADLTAAGIRCEVSQNHKKCLHFL